MPVDEKPSFADDLQAMSSALVRAGRIASTLQQRHEAEVCFAVREMREKVIQLTQQLANFQPPDVPQQIRAESPRGGISPSSGRHFHLPCEAFGEENAMLLKNDCLRKDGRSGGMFEQIVPVADEGSFGVDEDHSASGKAHLHSQPSKDSLLSATTVPACQQANSEHISNMALHEDKTTLYLKHTDSKLATHPSKADLGRPASKELLVSETPAPALPATQHGATPPSAGFMGGLREIWVDAKQESVEVLALLASRCFVNIVHYEEDHHRKPSLYLSAATMLLSSSSVRSQATSLCTGIHTCAYGIMTPVGPTRFCWNILCLLFIVYDMFAVPMQVFNIEDVKSTEVFEWMLTLWWTFDVYMTFRTGYIVGAHVEMRPRKIAYNYASTWLAVDIIIVTIEWINRLAVAVGSASLLRSSRVLRMFRCVRLFRASKIWGFWQALQDRVSSNIMTLCITMLALGGILLLTIHVLACIWYAVGKSRDDGWIAYDLYEGEKDYLFRYMASLRWVVAQLNGEIDTDERRNVVERLFTCTIGVVLAVAANAVFISFITKTMLDLAELLSEKTQRQRLVNQYLTANPLPSALSSQVKRCLHDYQDINKELQKEDQVLAILPNHLQTDVLEHVRAPVLMLHPFFRALPSESPWVMRMICGKVVRMTSATKDEVLFDTDDSCERMLFFDKLTGTYGNRRINFESEDAPHRAQTFRLQSFLSQSGNEGSGSSVKLLASSYGKKLRKIGMGSWISEAALWMDWKNRGCLVSDGHGVLFAVGASKLRDELKKYPHAFALACLHAQNFFSELSKHDPHKISDVLPFEVHVFSPLYLKITIVSASDLRNADVLAGKSDPYCVCKTVDVTGKSSKTCFKTKVLSNTVNPVWNHSSKIFVTWHQLIEFQIYDQDLISSDDVLGTARILATDLTPGFEDHLSLVTSDGTPCQGSLHVKIEITEAENPSLHHLWHPHLRKK